MNINIGTKIRELRLRNELTQNDLAEFLGVSSQAISRWEIGITYPDLELIPSIANCFNVTIDELFGCEGEREERISRIIAEADALALDGDDGVNIQKRLTILRNGLVEFPRNERLMYQLAAMLSYAGWRTIGQSGHYDEDGYLVNDIERHADNGYWTESIKLFEELMLQTKDREIINNSTYDLATLYNCLGQHHKALTLIDQMPQIWYSREMLRPYATDGKQAYQFFAEALLKCAEGFAKVVPQLIFGRKSNCDDDFAIRMIEGVIKIFEFVFEDGNMGPYHCSVSDLKCYLSIHQWRNGFHDEAFKSLDEALEHAKKRDAIMSSADPDPKYTARLLADVSMQKRKWGTEGFAKTLSERFPIWIYPNCDSAMFADARWEDWVKRTKEE